MGHDVWAFDYHLRLAFYQESLIHWAEITPGFERQDDDYAVLASEALMLETFDFVPDVVLIICGLALHRRAYDLIEKLGVPKVLVLTESPYDDQNQAIIMEKGGIAATLTNDKASVKPLRKKTGGRVEYLPHSYNPGQHFPRGKPDGKYLSDVFFFGTLWPERLKLFSHLGEFHQDGPNTKRITSYNGHNMNIAGIEPIRRGKVEGFIKNSELAWYYAGTKIAVNHTRTIIGEDKNGNARYIGRRQAWSLGPRPYEIAACGTFMLGDNKRPELKKVFGKSVPTYKNGKDLAKKVEYYLAHDDERLAMSSEALERVKNCSFEDRARQILIPLITEVV